MARLGLVVALLAAACRAVDIIPGAYIVELQDGHDAEGFFSSVAEVASPRLSFSHAVFNGASIQMRNLTTAEEVAKNISNLAYVKRVWPAWTAQLPDFDVKPVSKEHVELLRKRQGTQPGFAPHVMTEVDKLHKDGVTGKGIKIGIVDSGIDYTHPALGGCFGKGCLVVSGQDLIGNGNADNPQPDNDPMDCYGHGTYIAGIIAAQTTRYNFTGAAPGVTLGAYRVLTCTGGGTSSDMLMKGMTVAAADGCNIINLSIGGNGGWPENPLSVVASRLFDQGIVVTISAGNGGLTGLFQSTFPASGSAVSVGSVALNVVPSLNTRGTYTTGGGSSSTAAPKNFDYTFGEPGNFTNVKLPLWSKGTGLLDGTNDGCSYSAPLPDLTGKIALIQRGNCEYAVKAQYAVRLGASYVLLYNNEQVGSITLEAPVDGLKGIGMVSVQQAKEWLALMAAGSSVVVSMGNSSLPADLRLDPADGSGGRPHYGSSWGPTYEMGIKPEITAPGATILSTWLHHSYSVMTGTSFSAPMAAAVFALVGSARGTKDPVAIRNLLMSTAQPGSFYFPNRADAPAGLAPVPQQGSGLIQAYRAAKAKTTFKDAALIFNDTTHTPKSVSFTFTNTDTKAVTYQISHTPALTGMTFAQGTFDIAASQTLELVKAAAQLSFSSSSVTVDAGKSATISVSATAPTGLNSTRLPIYSGYVSISASNDQTFSIPYQGAAGSLKEIPVWDTVRTRFGAEDASGFQTLGPTTNYSFTVPAPGFGPDGSSPIPSVQLYMNFGTQQAHILIQPLYQREGLITRPVLGVPVLRDAPKLYSYPTPQAVHWTGYIDNDEYAPEGAYRIVFKALRVFGDPAVNADWDTWATPPFTIKYSGISEARKKIRRL